MFSYFFALPYGRFCKRYMRTRDRMYFLPPVRSRRWRAAASEGDLIVAGRSLEEHVQNIMLQTAGSLEMHSARWYHRL